MSNDLDHLVLFCVLKEEDQDKEEKAKLTEQQYVTSSNSNMSQ